MRLKGIYNDFACRRFSSTEPITPIPPLLWQKSISISDYFLVDGHQNIYVQMSSGQLRCYDKTGNQKWQTSITCCPQLYVGNSIYGTNAPWEYTEVYRIDSSNGSILNTYNIPGAPTCKGNGLNAVGNNIFTIINNYTTEWAKLGKIVDSSILIIADYTGIHTFGRGLTLDPERNRLLFVCQNPTQDYDRIVVINTEGSEIWRFPSLPEQQGYEVHRAVTDLGNRAHALVDHDWWGYFFGLDIEVSGSFKYYSIQCPIGRCHKPNGDFFQYEDYAPFLTSYDRDGNVRWQKDAPFGETPRICSNQKLVIAEDWGTGSTIRVLRTLDGEQLSVRSLGWRANDVAITANGYYCVNSSNLGYYATTITTSKLNHWFGAVWKPAKRVCEWDGVQWVEKHSKDWMGTEWKQFI